MVPPSGDPRIPIEKFYRAALYLVGGVKAGGLGRGIRRCLKALHNLFTVFP